MIGRCFYFGQGTTRNYLEAAEHFEASTEINPYAAFYLGECYRDGTGRKKDYKQAFEWYLKSAEQETDNAQMAIGRAFYLGEGVDEDNVEAVKWLKLAAEQDNAAAQYYLGECHLKGFGVSENEQKGIELLRASAAQGNTDAIEMLHENGFEVEEEQQNAVAIKASTVVEVFDDFASRARKLYSKTISSSFSRNNESEPNILDLQTERVERLNLIMSDNE